MTTNDIVAEIDAQIARLQQARELLVGTDATIKRKPGRPAGSTPPLKVSSVAPKKVAGNSKAARTLSVEARARIAASQKKRWAKSKKAAKKAARDTAATPAEKAPTARGIVKKTAPAKKAVAAKKAGPAKTAVPPAS